MTTDGPTIVAVIPVSTRDPVPTWSVHGRPIIDWTLQRWRATPGIDRIVLAADGASGPRSSLPIDDPHGHPPSSTVTGRDRASAIRAAVALAGAVEAVLLCPSDRPLGPASVVEALRSRLAGVDAVGAARPVRSTLKRIVDGRVVATVPRDAWRSDPGPWLFHREALSHALAVAVATGTDIVDGRDLVLLGDLRVRLIDAEATDLPIRTHADARFAERWLAATDGSTG